MALVEFLDSTSTYACIRGGVVRTVSVPSSPVASGFARILIISYHLHCRLLGPEASGRGRQAQEYNGNYAKHSGVVRTALSSSPVRSRSKRERTVRAKVQRQLCKICLLPSRGCPLELSIDRSSLPPSSLSYVGAGKLRVAGADTRTNFGGYSKIYSASPILAVLQVVH